MLKSIHPNISLNHIEFLPYDNIVVNELDNNNENEKLLLRVIAEMPIPNKRIIFIFFRLNLLEDEHYGKARVHANGYRNLPIPPILNDIVKETEWDYLVYVSKDVRISDDKIIKTVYFAHEIQHIIQYEFSKKIWEIGDELVDKGLDPCKVPMECDAERCAKRVTINIFGKIEFDRWCVNELKRAENYNSHERAQLKCLKKISLNGPDVLGVLNESKKLLSTYGD